MTDTQITTLAREYAEWVLSIPESEELPNCLRKEVTDTLVEGAEEVITWLLRRYCLVEKSKVEQGYKSSKHYFEHTDSSNPTQKQYFWGRMCAIESLFPEIAKAVEE